MNLNMKFFSLLLLLFFLYLNVTCNSKKKFEEAETIDNINNSLLVNSNMHPQCIDQCNSCQNSLYYLKIHGKIDCRFTQCPEECLSLTNEYFSNTNLHFSIFIKNEISICDTCFRLNKCHITQCDDQDKLIHQAITHSLSKTPILHRIKLDGRNEIIQSVNKDTEDYFFNMDLIMSNMNRLMGEIEKFTRIFNYSEDLKRIYLKLYKKVKGKDYSIGEFQINNNINNNSGYRGTYEENLKEFHSLSQVYYNELQKKKVRLYNDKIYDSVQIINDEKFIKRYDDLDINVKSLLNRVSGFKENLRSGIVTNISIIKNVKMAFRDNGKENTEENYNQKIKINILSNFKREDDLNLNSDAISSSRITNKNNISNLNNKQNSLKDLNDNNNINNNDEDGDFEDEIEEKIKKIKKLSKHPNFSNNRILSNEPSITQNLPIHHSMDIFSNKKLLLKNKQNLKTDLLPILDPKSKNILNNNNKLNNMKDLDEKLQIIDHNFNDIIMNNKTIINSDLKNKFPSHSQFNNSTTKKDNTGPLIIPLIPDYRNNSETRIINDANNDLDTLLDKRNDLMKQSSILSPKNNKRKFTLNSDIKKAIDKEIDDDKQISGLSKLYRKTIFAMKHLNKKIKKLKQTEKEINNVNSSKSNITITPEGMKNKTLLFKPNITINNSSQVDYFVTSVLPALKNSTNETNIQKEFNQPEFTNRTNKDNPIKYIPNSNIKQNLNSSDKNNNISNNLKKEEYIFENHLFDPSILDNNNNNNNNNKADEILSNLMKQEFLFQDEKEKPIPQRDYLINENPNKSLFPLLFVEKSMKNLDDDLYFITQKLYQDLI